LVNGLPLVQIELKKRGMEIAEAFNQTQRYIREAYWAGQGLFVLFSCLSLVMVPILVITNGTTGIEFAFPWADVANNKHQ
jgi:type I restriction enzyme R subunit